MFGIKLKGFKRSGKLYNLNRSNPSPASTPPLNGVKMGQPVSIAISGIKLMVFMTPKRKYDLMLF